MRSIIKVTREGRLLRFETFAMLFSGCVWLPSNPFVLQPNSQLPFILFFHQVLVTKSEVDLLQGVLTALTKQSI